ncbi:DMT family transporter [Amaricoccus sp.]|uniref:aromatic amino acid exporter YddG n=1 Tax=Amaricoccus sp. TaxID=1872485 RepID=UPI001B47A00B|nr:DMT family transporter [Amaricoccus sp.]MBP7001557.1 DMT family transporter [Amaricoccus sp.]
MTRGRATALGFGAIAMWALLALLTVSVGAVPPFQLTAICFTIGGALGLVWIAASGAGLARLRGLPPAVWLVGIGGLFGYHACYFTALRLAPPAQASLVAYLWPLLIVLFSGLLPGERLTARHIIGALVAFAGAGLVVLGPGASFSPESLPGLAAAAACAVIWAGYSVLSRRLGTAPTESVAVFCLATAALSALAHLAFETTRWPEGAAAWAATAALGAGPVGLAFYLWDFGCKRGDIQLLGVGAYAAPLVSTLLLVVAGVARPTPGLALAAVLVAGGALLAARATPRRSRSTARPARKGVQSLP